VCLNQCLNMLKKKIKIIFFNPPHADWSLANNLSYLGFQSYYQSVGKYRDQIEWLEAPYEWDKLESIDHIVSYGLNADIALFSSYIWNYALVDEIAIELKKRAPKIVTVLGGPHIGLNDQDFFLKRTQYDFICRPTKPGEVFIEDLIDSYYLHEGSPKFEEISWEVRSQKTRSYDFDHTYSIYEDHFDYLSKISQYARENGMEPFIALETTRGCPYRCTFCEWGGGIGTKILKRDLELVKRDIMAIKRANYREVYLTDANFGAFPERDIEIFKFAWQSGLILTDISTVKTPRLEVREKLIDSWFDIVGSHQVDDKMSEAQNKFIKSSSLSIVPTVSLQSISEKAMEIAQRIDLTAKDKLLLSHHIFKRCAQEGFPVPAIELILGMPGSTIDDFYEEMNILWNFKAWKSYRHDYMFLPDSELTHPDYLTKYNIQLVEVFTDIIDEDGDENKNSLYQGKKTFFKTISSCFSFTQDEMIEMWFMNHAGNFLLSKFFHLFEGNMLPSDFCRKSYSIMSSFLEFKTLLTEIKDLLDPQTPPKSIKRIQGIYRTEAIETLISQHRMSILNELMKFKIDGEMHVQRSL